VRVLELDLDVYQGPFDLLFTLILREEVDIYEVSLVEIILAYVEAMVQGDQVDWENLSEFLVLISALLEIKSRLLLPGAMGTDLAEMDPEQARDLLIDRLVRYHRFKLAGGSLRERLGEQQGRMVRAPERERRKSLPPLERLAGSLDPEALRRAMARVIEARRGPDTSHVAAVRVDLARQMGVLRRLLAERRRLSFDEVFGSEDPMVQAVSLFALLELLAEGAVRVSQRRPLADIIVEARRVGATARGAAGGMGAARRQGDSRVA
jgi:segregation and condensation protein A